MAEAADPQTVYNVVQKRYGKEYNVTLEAGVVKLRKGWNRGADIRMMAGCSMQGPDEKVFITQKSYLDENSGKISQRSAGACGLVGALAAWLLYAGGDPTAAVTSVPDQNGMGPIYLVYFGGMAAGSLVGWIAASVANSSLESADDRAQNKIWVESVRAFVNSNV
jgi:hypothetical protein